MKVDPQIDFEPEDFPRPEDVFFAWLLNLPYDVDTGVAAAEEIAKLDRLQFKSAAAQRLRELFLSALEAAIAEQGVN